MITAYNPYDLKLYGQKPYKMKRIFFEVIKFFTLYNVYSVPWEVISTVGSVQYYEVLSTVGGFSTVEGYYKYHGGR